MSKFYDQSVAHDILYRICRSAVDAMRELCQTDLGDGPFIFTYAKPVTGLETVPPPYLFVDLRPVHERAFRTVISKFKEQVKSSDFTDGQRINTFKVSLLSIVLTAADWIDPVTKSIADIVHYADKKPDKTP